MCLYGRGRRDSGNVREQPIACMGKREGFKKKAVSLHLEKGDTTLAKLVQGPMDLKEVRTLFIKYLLCVYHCAVFKDEKREHERSIFTLANNWSCLQRIL